MNKPERLTDKQLVRVVYDAYYDRFIESARALEKVINRRWEESLAMQEPVATVVVYPNGSSSISWSDRVISGLPDGTKLYPSPVDQQAEIEHLHRVIEQNSRSAQTEIHKLRFALERIAENKGNGDHDGCVARAALGIGGNA